MKHLILIPILLLLTITASAQQMRDSSATKPVLTKNLMITCNYGGVVTQYLVPAEDVAAYINGRGASSADSLNPIADAVLSHIKGEIGQYVEAWQARKQAELGLLDPDVMTLTAMRQAAAAIRLRYRQYQYPYSISVPVVLR